MPYTLKTPVHGELAIALGSPRKASTTISTPEAHREQLGAWIATLPVGAMTPQSRRWGQTAASRSRLPGRPQGLISAR
jgi:hypothetical protein